MKKPGKSRCHEKKNENMKHSYNHVEKNGKADRQKIRKMNERTNERMKRRGEESGRRVGWMQSQRAK